MPDGHWRHPLGAGAGLAAGNSDATSVNLSVDSVRAADIDKWGFTRRALNARSADTTTGERLALGSDFWVVSAGLGYTRDRLATPTDIGGTMRSRYGRAELLPAEASSLLVGSGSTWRQRLRVLPSLRESGRYRADCDANLTMAIHSSINPAAGLTYRYDTTPCSASSLATRCS